MLLSALLLGLYAGLSPGPLMALLLAQTLRHGPREGFKGILLATFGVLLIWEGIKLATRISSP